jgi:tight adherence protein B
MTVRRPPAGALLAFFIACAIVVLSTMPAHALASKLEVSDVDISQHPRVSLIATVPAGVGSDLPSSAFTVTEGGTARPIRVERLSQDDSLAVVIAIDTSGSMAGAAMDAAKSAAASFVRRLRPSTPISVIGFGASAVAAPFSTDQQETIARIGALEASGETSLYDALVVASSELYATKVARRAIVVLSDGGDTVSTASLDQALTALHGAGARASVVELASDESNHDALSRIADGTHGRLVAASDASALQAAYGAVAADLLGQYRLTFDSAANGPTDVVVRVDAGATHLSTTTRLTYPAAAVATAKAPVAETAGEPGLVSRLGLVLGAVAIFGALLLIGLMLLRRDRPQIRLSGSASTAASAVPTSFSGFAERATAAAEQMLERRGSRRGLDALLEEAGLAIRAGELLVIATTATIAAFAIGTIVSTFVVGVALAGMTAVGTKLLLSILRDRRQRKFADQLEDLLAVLAGSLRAGYGLMQALETAGRELESPAADELRRLSTEVRLGRDFSDSLDALAARVGSEDFEWVSQAIRIHREVGGDLSEVLDRISETIRARGRLKRQVQALSAEGRMSAYVLFSLPFALAALISVVNREYLGLLFTTGIGAVMLGVGASLMLVGGLWLRRLVRPVY